MSLKEELNYWKYKLGEEQYNMRYMWHVMGRRKEVIEREPFVKLLKDEIRSMEKELMRRENENYKFLPNLIY